MENAYYILTLTAQTDPAALKDFKELVASLGAIPMVLDYEQHDYATAAISHLPHIIAYSLVNLVKSCDDCEGTMKPRRPATLHALPPPPPSCGKISVFPIRNRF